MMVRAFLEIAKVMSRLCLKDRDIEIVIRCRTRSIQAEIEIGMLDEAMQAGAYSIVDESVKRGYGQGTAHGVPYRFEVMP